MGALFHGRTFPWVHFSIGVEAKNELNPADSLVDIVNDSALHRFEVLRVRAQRPITVW